MKHYRISIDVDIEARDRAQAELRAACLYSKLGQRVWIVEVLPNGIEERIPIAPMAQTLPTKKERLTSGPSLRHTLEIASMTDNLDTALPEIQLPPDPDGMNDERSSWAEASLQTFMAMTGSELEDALGDLLADLIHWSDRNNFDFDAALVRARGHYQAETGGEEFA